MTRPLYVAAGGGGDALAAMIIRHAVDRSGTPPVVLSYSWDRYLLDPTPGPRTPQDFTRLRRLTEHSWEVAFDSQLSNGGRSGLAVLAQHTNARYVLMDPTEGANGIRQQVGELIDLLDVDAVTLVDVGGDVAGHGDEPTLLSPLGDSLALAALAGLPVPTNVAILGVGLDGELPESAVLLDLANVGATSVTLQPAHVEPYFAALEHHPSEATMLVAAAATGIHGRAEIRDKGAHVQLTSTSKNAFFTTASAVLKINNVAQALIATTSFSEAEAVTADICGKTELNHERRKARALASDRPSEPPEAELRQRFSRYQQEANARGVDLVSFRRLTEIIGKHRYDPPAIRRLVGDLAFAHLPLCRIGY